MAYLPSPRPSDESHAINALPPLLETVIHQRLAMSNFPFELSPTSRATSPESEARTIEIRDAITRRMRRSRRGASAMIELVCTRLRCGPFTQGAARWGRCVASHSRVANGGTGVGITLVAPNHRLQPLQASQSSRQNTHVSPSLQTRSEPPLSPARKRRRLSNSPHASSRKANGDSRSRNSEQLKGIGLVGATSRFFQSISISEENTNSFDASPFPSGLHPRPSHMLTSAPSKTHHHLQPDQSLPSSLPLGSRYDAREARDNLGPSAPSVSRRRRSRVLSQSSQIESCRYRDKSSSPGSLTRRSQEGLQRKPTGFGQDNRSNLNSSQNAAPAKDKSRAHATSRSRPSFLIDTTSFPSLDDDEQTPISRTHRLGLSSPENHTRQSLQKLAQNPRSASRERGSSSGISSTGGALFNSQFDMDARMDEIAEFINFDVSSGEVDLANDIGRLNSG